MQGLQKHNRSVLLISLCLLLAFTASAVLLAISQLRSLSSDSLLVRTLFDASGILPLPEKTNEFFGNMPVSKLCSAIERYDMDQVEALLKATRDVNQTGKYGVTPLTWALLHRHDRIYEPLLAHGADPDIRVSEDVRLYSISLEAGDSFLLGCVKQLQFSGLELAVKYTKQINQRDKYGNGLLPHFIANTYTEFERPPPSFFSEILDTFLQEGLDIDAQHAQGNTALHFAFEYHIGSSVPLLQCGADPLKKNDNRETAVDLFLVLAKQNPESAIRASVFKQLQKQGYLDKHSTLEDLLRERFPQWKRPKKTVPLSRKLDETPKQRLFQVEHKY